MTETTRTVFDLYQVRKTKKQKAAFREYLRDVATREGYDCHEEKGSLGARNFVVGDPTTARVVYTAHYDTCARLPFPNFITPTNFGIYLLYQLLIVIGFFAVAALITTLVTVLMALLVAFTAMTQELAADLAVLSYYVALLAGMWLLVAGPANKHTANDNTSGVTTLLDLMIAMPEDLRGEVAFLFFDLEEMGLFGSAGYYGRHKSAMKNTLLLNFDCVSDGDTILFAVRKKAAHMAPLLENAFPAEGKCRARVLTKGVFYPSDQAQFPCGVGVAALKETRRGLLYMNRIHTKRDTVYEEENIAYLVSGSVRLTRALQQAEHP